MEFLDYVEKKEEGLSLEEIRQFFGMEETEFRRRLFSYGVEVDSVKRAEIKNRWTKEQTEYLKNNYFLKTNAELRKILNKNQYAIEDKVKELVESGEMKARDRTLSASEKEFARNAAAKKSVYEIANILKVKPHIISQCIRNVKRPPQRKWTKTELTLLAQMWSDNVNVYIIAHKLKHDVDAVKVMARKIGAKRNSDTEHKKKVMKKIEEEQK